MLLFIVVRRPQSLLYDDHLSLLAVTVVLGLGVGLAGRGGFEIVFFWYRWFVISSFGRGGNGWIELTVEKRIHSWSKFV